MSDQIEPKRGPGRPPNPKPEAGPDLATAILALAEKLGGNQETLNETLASLRASQTPRDVDFSDSDYQAKLRREQRVLKRPAFQNGFEINPSGMSETSIERLAQLRPGTYIGGRVRVALDGNDGIHLIYKNKTVEQRFDNELALFDGKKSLAVLIDKIWAEQGAA